MAAKTTAKKTNVTLEIGSDTLSFKVDINAFNTFQNEMMPYDKVAPSENFLMATVDPEQKDILIKLFDGGYGVELGGIVASEFKPELAFKVKK